LFLGAVKRGEKGKFDSQSPVRGGAASKGTT
jgi:hypothetical protein